MESKSGLKLRKMFFTEISSSDSSDRHTFKRLASMTFSRSTTLGPLNYKQTVAIDEEGGRWMRYGHEDLTKFGFKERRLTIEKYGVQ